MTADVEVATRTLSIDEVAVIQHCTVRAVYCRLYKGTMLPAPIAEHPYRWNPADLERWRRGEFYEAERTLKAKAKRRPPLRVVTK